MPECPGCGRDVAYVYDPDEELLVIDARRCQDGNVSLDGPVSCHAVTPGTGTHRLHVCAPAAGRPATKASHG